VKGASVSDGEAHSRMHKTARNYRAFGKAGPATTPTGRAAHLGPAVDGLGADESIRSCEATTLGVVSRHDSITGISD
jgi:hypothetical protein